MGRDSEEARREREREHAERQARDEQAMYETLEMYRREGKHPY